jgi:hypothetical protein
MNLKILATIMNQAFQYVIQTSQKYNIDESHALKHSMDVLHFSNQIYQQEVMEHDFLEPQKNIIFACSILHDMCDKKYMNEQFAIEEMREYMNDYMDTNKLNVVTDIISTMSYSKVMKKGYPELGDYQLAYHIVREADLLAAYDLDRCIIYQMMHEKYSYTDSLEIAVDLFHKRVLRYIDHDLFITSYSKKKASELHLKALKDIEHIKLIL